MKTNLKKVIFPFFNKVRHDFLMKKWWFRLLIVFYAIGIVVLLHSIWSYFEATTWGWCYDELHLYGINNAEWTWHLNLCNKIREENFAWVLPGAFISTAVIHYIIQFVFFKIIINFVVLGNKK